MALLSVDDAIHEFCTLQKSWLETELRAGEEEDKSEPARPRDESSKGGKTTTDKKKKPHGTEGTTKAPEASSERHAASSILTKLESLQISVGLYGRTVVQLGRSGDQSLLPVHIFTTGDEVEIRNSNNNKATNGGGTTGGVICEVTETSLSVALFSSSGRRKNKGGSDEPAAESFFDAPPYTIIPRSNVQVHEKMVSALSELRQHGIHHPVAGKVVEALFRKVEFPPVNENDEDPAFPPFNPRLDASQLAAISFALSSKRPVALIHGPVRVSFFLSFWVMMVVVK
jgi:hypothetical protein